MNYRRLESAGPALRPAPPPAPIRNPVTLLLLWASKTDPRLVAICSRWAIATQAAMGVFVFFTAAMAAGSIYYTVSTLHASDGIAMSIAAAFGIFIFFLDREIVGGIDNLSTIVRPVLALFLGTIATVPIELWIFQSRIDQDLQRQYLLDNKAQFDALHSAQGKIEQRRAEFQKTLDALANEEAEWGKAISGGLTGMANFQYGQRRIVSNAQGQQARVQQRIQEVRRDLDQFEKSLPADRDRQDKQFAREETSKVTDFVTRYEAMDRVVHDSPALYRMSWWITITLIIIDMTPAFLKLMTPHVDYHHLVKAGIRENVTRVDEISDLNYRLAMENPELPELSVAEKFGIVLYAPASPVSVFGRQR